jgi:DNA-binding PadR family transcriptional regulator
MRAQDRLPLTPLSFQVLVALARQPRHGYGIIKAIEATTGEPMRSSTGTLYLAIERLEQEGLIAEKPSSHSRRRYYGLTSLGRAVAAAEARRLATLLGVAAESRLIGRAQLDDLLRSRTP